MPNEWAVKNKLCSKKQMAFNRPSTLLNLFASDFELIGDFQVALVILLAKAGQ
jgi:hypothetical protein